jgi:hypothetical protein
MHHLSLLFACFLFLVFQGAIAFSESFDTSYHVLGANLVTEIDPKTGFMSGRDSRLNIYGESSSLSFNFKPHNHKLQLMLQEVHSCFDVRCGNGQVIMNSKLRLRDNPGCISAGVKAFASSPLTTRRILRYDLQRQPLLSDLSVGDFLHLDPTCALGESQSRVITSIDGLSVAIKGTKSTAFVINTREADLIDAFSEGEYQFRTDNILTVNDAPVISPLMKPRWGFGDLISGVVDAFETAVEVVSAVVDVVTSLLNNEFDGAETWPLVNLVSASAL